MRHGENKDLAHTLFVEQCMTFEEIAARTGRNEKTVRDWADEGNWKADRETIQKSRYASHEKLHTLVEKLTDRMIRDCQGENDVSPQSLAALKNLINAINDLYKYEGSVKKLADDKKPRERGGLTDETLRNMEQQMKLL